MKHLHPNQTQLTEKPAKPRTLRSTFRSSSNKRPQKRTTHNAGSPFLPPPLFRPASACSVADASATRADCSRCMQEIKANTSYTTSYKHQVSPLRPRGDLQPSGVRSKPTILKPMYPLMASGNLQWQQNRGPSCCSGTENLYDGFKKFGALVVCTLVFRALYYLGSIIGPLMFGNSHIIWRSSEDNSTAAPSGQLPSGPASRQLPAALFPSPWPPQDLLDGSRPTNAAAGKLVQYMDLDEYQHNFEAYCEVV